MIEMNLFAAFILASALLILVPGPNVALIVSHSVVHGTRYGLLTVAATTSIQIIPLSLVALGMSAAVTLTADWFDWLRWIGIAYLIALGVATWRVRENHTIERNRKGRIGRTVIVRSMLVAATNPKTLLFYGAFLPQFVDADRPALPQFAILSATFILAALGGDSLWALAAGRARFLLARTARIRNRISGVILIVAGLGMAFARKS
jgi:threonine/homoserine/homoserine lactone efflux protein